MVTFEQFGVSCKAFADGLPKTVQDALVRLAVESKTNIKNDAPVDTGYMQDNVNNDKPNPSSVRIFSPAFYSNFVDKGHRTRSGSTVPPNPFFTNEVNALRSGKISSMVYYDMTQLMKRVF